MTDNDLIRRGDVLAIVKPDGARDCDCTRCICGDEIEVSLWDQSKRHSDAIAALPAVDADPLVAQNSHEYCPSMNPNDCGDCIYCGCSAGHMNHALPAADPLADPRVQALVEALDWYREQARLARLIHSEGDAGRHALQADGGKRAAAALAAFKGGE
jgi:hypothetical protein